MENVLVLKTELLAPHLTARGFISGCEKEILKLTDTQQEFIERGAAESDPGYRQIIPYVVIRRGEEIFATKRLRGGGETRLHGLISIGIGGHVSRESDGDGADVLYRGLMREIMEEVTIDGYWHLKLRGIINDDSNSVGSVHLGVLLTLDTTGDVTVRETEKLSGRWYALSELSELAGQMETWSQIALGAL